MMLSEELDFGQADWERAILAIEPGGSISAPYLLTLLEQEPEETAAEALELLEQRDILIETAELPCSAVHSQTEQRLHLEQSLVEQGRLPQGLEEGDPLRIYLEELAATPCFGDAHALAADFQKGRQEAGQQLVCLMLSRVLAQAYQAVGRGVLLLDLIQEGSLALWQAVLDYEQGDIGAHCDRAIRRGISALIFRQARANGVGLRLRQAMEDYRGVDERLLTELGRNPTLEEIAQELHMTVGEVAQVANALDTARQMGQLRQPRPVEVEEQHTAVEDTAYFRQRRHIEELLAGLEPMEQKIISLRFGLEQREPLSPAETGAVLGLTAGQVVDMEAAALAKIRSQQ